MISNVITFLLLEAECTIFCFNLQVSKNSWQKLDFVSPEPVIVFLRWEIHIEDFSFVSRNGKSHGKKSFICITGYEKVLRYTFKKITYFFKSKCKF